MEHKAHINGLKEKILKIKRIKKGFILTKEEIFQILKAEEEQDQWRILIALSELIREGKLPYSSAVPNYKTMNVVVQSFSRENRFNSAPASKEIRFKGEKG